MTEQEPKKFDQYWIRVAISLLLGIGLPALIIDTFYPDIGTIKLIGYSIAAFAAIITIVYVGYVYVWGVFVTLAGESPVLLVLILCLICLLLITYKLFFT